LIASAFPDIGFDFLVEPLSVAGLLLLLLYAWFRAHGRELLPRGPSPKPAVGIPESLLVYLGALGAQIAIAGAAMRMGMAKGPLLNALSYAGFVSIALIAWYAWLARRAEHGPPVRGAVAGLLACFATMPVVAAVLVAWTRLYTAAGGAAEEQQILTNLRGDWPIFFLVAVVLAPFTEEVLFRGLLQPALKRRLGAIPAVVLTAAGFAVVHVSITVAPAIFVLGLALGYVYERTGTLAAPIAFHAAFNGVTFLGELMG